MIVLANIIKSTDYCDLIKQGKVIDGSSVYAIEEIFVKEKKTTEIRFAYYKKNDNGDEKFVPRPLDLEEEHLLALLKEGIKADILSKESLINMFKEIK